MAITDLYVSTEEYAAAAKGNADDDTIPLDLEAAQDLVERELGVVRGAFNAYTGTVTLDGAGSAILRLRDTDGRQFFLRSIDADSLKLDTDADGAFDDYTLDLSDAWVRGLPANAALASEPYTALELLAISTATVTRFPSNPASVQITGTFGWAAVPQLIKAIVISVTRELRDHFGAGSVGVVQRMDDALPISDQTWRIIRSAKQRYNYRLLVIA